MALGLNRVSRGFSNAISTGVTLNQVLADTAGFPVGYLPTVRELEGVRYIRTFGKGRDSDNMPVYYKWIFIDPSDNSATPDSDSEFARIPEKGFIMRIIQRNLLPYHENFVIDYYEDINNLNIISCSDSHRKEWANRSKNVYRQFRIVNPDPAKAHIPNDLTEEIFSYPKEFFEKFIRDAIPTDMIWNESHGSSSNHISSYGGRSSTLDLGARPMGQQHNSGGGFRRSSMGAPSSRVSVDAAAYRNRVAGTMDRINNAGGNVGMNPSSNQGNYNQIDSPNSPIKRFSTW